MAPFVSQILHPEDEQRRSFEEKIIILPQVPSSAPAAETEAYYQQKS